MRKGLGFCLSLSGQVTLCPELPMVCCRYHCKGSNVTGGGDQGDPPEWQRQSPGRP